jgi:hypothetical protein
MYQRTHSSTTSPLSLCLRKIRSLVVQLIIRSTTAQHLDDSIGRLGVKVLKSPSGYLRTTALLDVHGGGVDPPLVPYQLVAPLARELQPSLGIGIAWRILV